MDLVALLAESDPERTEAELRRELGEVQEIISWWDSLGRVVALVMIVGGSAGMALVFAFNPKGMMRWPGLSLLIGGAAFLRWANSCNQASSTGSAMHLRPGLRRHLISRNPWLI